MYNYICKECGGHCDAGELVHDVCPECMEERRLAGMKLDQAVKLLNAPCEQIVLDFGGIISVGDR